jgi:hypothetical protein
MIPPPMNPSVEDIMAALGRHGYMFSHEEQLQNAVALALEGAGIPFQREARLNEHDRIDFLVGTIGIEVKIDGSISALVRQLFRYAHNARGDIDSLVVVVGKLSLANLPVDIEGVQLHVFRAVRAFQ